MAKTTAKTMETAFEPFVEYNNIVIKTAETAFKMQMDSMQSYAKLGMENINEAFKVRTLDDVFSYADKQKDIAKTSSDMLVSDAKAFADLNAKFIDSTRTLIESNVKSTVEAATEAAKAASDAVKKAA
ncbi:MAG: phasin family protein [Arenicella sp.]